MTRTITDMSDFAITIDLLSQLTVMAFAKAYNNTGEGAIVLESVENRLKGVYSEEDVLRLMADYRRVIELFWND